GRHDGGHRRRLRPPQGHSRPCPEPITHEGGSTRNLIMNTTPTLGRFAVRHALAIVFISTALCLAGSYAALTMPSSVFPQTDFPRCVILVDNGVMPADEMMATITRPIEEAMKDIPGAVSVRSATGRGSAEVNVFFNWQVDMI